MGRPGRPGRIVSRLAAFRPHDPAQAVQAGGRAKRPAPQRPPDRPEQADHPGHGQDREPQADVAGQPGVWQDQDRQGQDQAILQDAALAQPGQDRAEKNITVARTRDGEASPSQQ